MALLNLKIEFRDAGSEIYDKYTVGEWIETNIVPYERKLVSQWMAREKLLSKVDWPRRPFNLQVSEYP